MQPHAPWTSSLFALLGLVAVAVVVLLVAQRLRAQHRKKLERTAAEAARARAASSSARPRRLTLPDLHRASRAAFAPVIVTARPSSTRHPLVLAHGYGFGAIGLSRIRREYFVGIRERLETLGHRVHLVRVAPAAGIALRAAQLTEQIKSIGADRVNIIAHSMGGLDARYAISRLGLGDKVASLTTIGTPHRGTPLADRGVLALGEWRNLRQVLHTLGANVDGLYDLRTDRMERFNRAVLDRADVFYSSVVGAVPREDSPINTLLGPPHAYLLRTSGDNDGIVPVESQKWGEVVGEVKADHWEQIGWSRRFDARSFYAILAEHLAAWGL